MLWRKNYPRFPIVQNSDLKLMVSRIFWVKDKASFSSSWHEICPAARTFRREFEFILLSSKVPISKKRSFSTLVPRNFEKQTTIKRHFLRHLRPSVLAKCFSTLCKCPVDNWKGKQGSGFFFLKNKIECNIPHIQKNQSNAMKSTSLHRSSEWISWPRLTILSLFKQA